MSIIFDTETTGLPICFEYGSFPNYKDLDKYRFARVVQVSYIITDDFYNKLEEADYIIKTDNFSIDNSQFHGITNEISHEKGISFLEFAQMFSNSLDFVDKIIAHNINFDINVIRSELYRYNLFDIIVKIDSKRVICTMKLCKTLVNAKFKYNNSVKDPSLKELFEFITGEKIENQHNSLYDVLNLHKIVKSEMVKKLIKKIK